ncbi:MAG: DUF3137 domain-containing protein [Planctomycetaceae bacterium]|nr:MAG: DUF3137 domain-containing protein [Planctomycetaceae bacterium]
MKTLDQILPNLLVTIEPIEKQRLESIQSRNQGYLAIAVTLALGGIGVLASLSGGLPPYVPIVLGIVALLTSGILFATWIHSPYAAFRDRFKNDFIGRVLASIADEVQYFPAGNDAILQDYKASELFPKAYDRVSIEDTIFCRLGETDLRLSEIHTEYKTTSTDKDGNTQEHWHTLFRGLFLSADFHKEFHGRTLVRTDFAEKRLGVLGRFFQKPIFSSDQLVILEDPDFEREFVVHSSDQIEARYILSTSMMEKMLELKHRFASDVEYSFLHSRMFIAVSTTRNFFEPKQSVSLTDREYLQDFLDQTNLCLGIVETLGLNVRIWSKR